MRKLVAALIAITLISIPVSAEAAIKPGSTCPTISKTATVGKVSYTCAKQGTRKVWLQTIRVGAPCKKAGVSAVVLKKKYLCKTNGKSRTWSLIKIAGANQPDKSPAPSSIEASINIIYDEVSAKSNIPVTIERIDPVGTNAVKSFKRELTKSASLTSLLPGRYELTLGIEKIDVAQGSYLGMLSSSVILLSKGESRSAEVNFSTLMPKSTHAVSKTDYTEFKELSDGAIQFKSASLSNQDIKVNEYLILPPSSELESGYIGKVVSKSADAFLLNPASYFDAIPQGSFHSVIDLGSDDYTFQPTFEAGNIKGNLKSKTQAESKIVKDFVVKALKCSIDKGVEKTLKVEPNIQIENDFVWPSSNPTYSLGIRAGVDINIGKTAGASISCSAEVAANNIPIPLSACPKCLQVDVNIRLSGSASIVGKTGAISIPIYLSGGVHAPLTGAPSFYKLTELSSSVTPGIINGSLEATLAGSINLHTPKNVIVLSGEVGVAFTKSLNMSLSKCTVSRETQSSFRLTGKIGLTAKIDAVVLEVSKSVSLEASVKKDFNKTIDSFNVLTQFCENAPSPSPTPTTKPAVTLNTSYFPFSGNFRVSGNGQAADLYFNLTGGRQITIIGSVPRDTSEGTLTIYYAEGASRTFMQSYEIGMGVHSHSFVPKRDGVYEFKIYFNSSAGKTKPDLIFISIS